MKFRNIGKDSLIVDGGIVHAGAEVECERDPRIDGLVPVTLTRETRAHVDAGHSPFDAGEPVRKVGVERGAEKPDEEPEEETEDDFGGGA